jgi:small subunit ribosomal protein S1
MLRARMSKQDFASLLEASMKSGRGARRLKHGDTVEGTVIQIGDDTIFLDVGASADARLDRAEVVDAKGVLTLKVGDRIRAVVVDTRNEAPKLSLGVGRGPADVSGLELARESGAHVTGRVLRAVKGGVEVDVGGVRAFCPASHLEIGRVLDLAVYEGQAHEFRVLEVKDGGRSIVLSRRAILEDEQRERRSSLLEKLSPGADVEGVVHSLERHGAVVDLGGIEGFVHISELSHHRVERAEDVVSIGQPVTLRVLSIGARVRLSMKAREQAPLADAAAPDEVLAGTVVRSAGGGVIVNTTKGEGLIPVRELGLAPGADHRRAFPPGRELKVVVLSRDAQSGRMRLSKARVADVEERQNYQDFSRGTSASAAPTKSLGSLGDLLRSKLGMPPEAPPPPAEAAAPAPERAAPAPAVPAPAPQKAAAPAPEPARKAERDAAPRAPDPPGVVRRRRG